jgi:cytochrome b subunit of formate dehydrogenase
MRTFATLSLAGISGIVIFKLLLAVMFPMFGMILGLVIMTVKFALVAAVIFFVYSMIRKKKEEQVA